MSYGGYIGLEDWRETGDPHWDNVGLMLDCEGTDAATSITDLSPTPKTITFTANAQVDTDKARYGSSSILFDGTDDRISVDTTSTDFGFGTGDLTVEFSFWLTTLAAGDVYYMFDLLTNKCSIQVQGSTYGGTNGRVFVNMGGGTSLDIDDACNVTGQWYDVMLRRRQGVLSFFVNGIEATGGVNGIVNRTDVGSTNKLYMGGYSAGTPIFDGWLDNVRVTKGVGRDPQINPTRAWPRSTSSGVFSI